MGFALSSRRTIDIEVQPFRIDATDRVWFKRCRRAWDLGARARRNYAPAIGPDRSTIPTAVAEALAVYYFPGMWSWKREIVQPLVHRALDRAAAGEPAAAVDAAHALLDRYAAWASELDRFTPVRVAADVEVNIPDPLLSDRELATADGRPVRFTTQVDALVLDDGDDQPRLLCHRVGAGPFTDAELLALDEAALTNCWAWEQLTLDPRLAGILYNEVRLDGDGDEFRRTLVPVTRAELALAGRQLGREVLDMLDEGLWPYPNPLPESCAVCAFRAPCRAMREGRDPEPILRARYVPRADTPWREGRLGGQTWSMSRGARPDRFGP
jgi:hypothetical protein